jgi:hypothetical protein
LVATVVLPLQTLCGSQFELAPFGVLLKPSHGKQILGVDKRRRGGFSPQAEYIFRKQLEEADYLMIGRRDMLTPDEIDGLKAALAEQAPGIPIIAVSPLTGEGIDEALGYIESPMIAGRRLLDIDYDTYAQGEAELGWVNLTATLTGDHLLDLNDLVTDIVRSLGTRIVSTGGGEIAHVKASTQAGDQQAVVNMVSNDQQLEIGLCALNLACPPVQLMINARVAMDPDELEGYCRSTVEEVASANGLCVNVQQSRALRPGRPTPTHRYAR